MLTSSQYCKNIATKLVVSGGGRIGHSASNRRSLVTNTIATFQQHHHPNQRTSSLFITSSSLSTSTSSNSLTTSLLFCKSSENSSNRNNNHHYTRGGASVLDITKKSFSTTNNNDSEENDTTTKKESSNNTNTNTTTTKETTINQQKDVETLNFQAETKQLLDIVINSLYTDKDVFVRELVSNASDALEKLRHIQVTNQKQLDTSQTDVPLEIRINVDEVSSTITITDTGIGMNKDEIISNLGTIARSGSKNFVRGIESNKVATDIIKDPKSLQLKNTDAASSIIGQFGVGFYSSFMVADKVEVRSRSAVMTSTLDTDNVESITPPETYVWTSDGVMGNYTIGKLNDDDIRQDRGTSIVLYIKPGQWDYVSEGKLELILKRYSNFINFPIYLNGNRINTQKAIWTIDPKDISENEYVEFYKYYANAMDVPLDIYHFRTDAPIEMKVLLFTPTFHNEKYGMGRMEPGVNLYSRKVLIESKCKDIVPDWMRFVKGVVDSEDLPLAISREKAQDTALIQKLRKTIVRKFIAHLTSMKKKDSKKFINTFYDEYSFFIKEGICQDYEFQGQLSKLLHFQTSKSSDLISLDEYISNMRPEQNDIYYLIAPNRTAALQSPYLEVFDQANVEVFIMFSSIEDFVMANLEKYEGRKLISVEKSDIDLSDFIKADKKKAKNSTEKSDEASTKEEDTEEDDDDDESNTSTRTLTSEQVTEFCEWFRMNGVGDYKVASCKSTTRLITSPAIVTDNESGSIRRMMRLIDASSQDGASSRDAGGLPLPPQNVLINPNHTVIIGIYHLIHSEPTLAKVLAQQIYDNCLIAAGLLDDSRSMLPRINDILVCVINGAKQQQNQEKVQQVKEEESTTTTTNSDIVEPEELSITNKSSTIQTDTSKPTEAEFIEK